MPTHTLRPDSLREKIVSESLKASFVMPSGLPIRARLLQQLCALTFPANPEVKVFTNYLHLQRLHLSERRALRRTFFFKPAAG